MYGLYGFIECFKIVTEILKFGVEGREVFFLLIC